MKLAFFGSGVILVALITAGLMFAVSQKILGIPLAAALVPLFFKYCFVVLDAAVAGDNHPPVLAIEMVNPVNEPRPVSEALLIISGVLVAKATFAYVGHAAGVLVSAVLLFVFPSSIASLGLSANPFLAAWPPRWWYIIGGLKGDYLILVALMIVCTGIEYAIIHFDAPAWAIVLSQQLLILVLFASVGRAVFEHRIDFALLSKSPEEHLEERAQREHERMRQKMIDDAYVQFRHNKPREGWRELEAWLTKHAQGMKRLSEYNAVLEAAGAWDDKRPADRIANDLIAILLNERATGVALGVAERQLARNPKFQPPQAVRLAELAGLAGKRALKRQLEAAAAVATPTRV
jgi:hypothetical protein